MSHDRIMGHLGLTVLASVLLLPAPAWAQAISGLVRDASVGVLPGVTVEAASPALIEKVRTVQTDGQGRYNIVDLRPGTYVVTFSLSGFGTIRREGIELTSGFTATVDADLQVGALQETIVVTGASPLIDTQNVVQQNLVPKALLDSLPSSSKSVTVLASIVPGLSGPSDGGGAVGLQRGNNVLHNSIHGKAGSKYLFDGMQTNNFTPADGGTSYLSNPAFVLEIAVQTGGIDADSNASGISFNMIPKEGGNRYAFELNGMYSGEGMQSSNLSDGLRARGVRTRSRVLQLYDATAAVGGPIKKDRLWLFTASRFAGNKNTITDVYFNKTQGTLLFTPDFDRSGFAQGWMKTIGSRATWQVSSKNKVSGFFDVQPREHRADGNFVAPEAQTCSHFGPGGMYLGSWSAPLTTRWLLDAGASLTMGGYPCTREQTTDNLGFVVAPNDISVLEQSSGLRYNAKSFYWLRDIANRYVERFGVAYVTGSHAFKTGFQLQQHIGQRVNTVNGDRTYTFLNGRPTLITQYATPTTTENNTTADLGIYVQDRWTTGRLTLNGGVRLDYFNGEVPPQHMPPTPSGWIPERTFAAVHNVPEFIDLNSRLGVAYSLTDTGRTVVKSSLGRYVGGQTPYAVTSAVNPVSSVAQVDRTWTDGNENYIPECDLGNFAANGECGAISNANFGKLDPSATQYADDLIRGFGTRDYFWDFSTEVQHQLGRGTSVRGGYFRNWSNHPSRLESQNRLVLAGWAPSVIDNLAWTPADFDPYCITAPVDNRLPGGGGYQVCGLYDISPSKFGQGNNLVARPSSYGKRTRVSDFFNIIVDSRLPSGLLLGGSVDTGQTVTDDCYVIDSPQRLRYCRVVTPFKGQTQAKMYGSYPLPADFVVSGVLVNQSGVSYGANLPVPNSAIVPSLGRNVAACGTRAVCSLNVVVPIVPPDTLFEPRRTQLDLRLSKIFRLNSFSSGARLQVNVDIYNALNDSSVLWQNETYGSSWRMPQASASALLRGFRDARLVQLSGQVNW